ncbi:hypothetical protein JRQ81_000008 [Phrynocephalus forsythii]|uniref:Uncharacterized protein n=1 Tax=Phrynocephalus forsythii TaxID=171643 RepID=A0A9Q0X5I8_9SAUR|nr:hypothetical protein JRQ81_000008 [Phrynocephalus forsythii]
MRKSEASEAEEGETTHPPSTSNHRVMEKRGRGQEVALRVCVADPPEEVPERGLPQEVAGGGGVPVSGEGQEEGMVLESSKVAGAQEVGVVLESAETAMWTVMKCSVWSFTRSQSPHLTTPLILKCLLEKPKPQREVKGAVLVHQLLLWQMQERMTAIDH